MEQIVHPKTFRELIKSDYDILKDKLSRELDQLRKTPTQTKIIDGEVYTLNKEEKLKSLRKAINSLYEYVDIINTYKQNINNIKKEYGENEFLDFADRFYNLDDFQTLLSYLVENNKTRYKYCALHTDNDYGRVCDFFSSESELLAFELIESDTIIDLTTGKYCKLKVTRELIKS